MISERQLTSTIFVVIAILTSGYALATTVYSPLLYIGCLIGSTIFLIRATIKQNGMDATKFRVILILYVSIMIPAIASVVVNARIENAISVFKLALVMTYGAVLYMHFSFKSLSKIFADAIFVICIISLSGYVLTNFTDLLANAPTISNVNNVDYKFALIFLSFDGFLQYRNIGVFWEPGIFSTMIFCALLADLFFAECTNIKRTIIFFITLVTTFSTAGLILFSLYVGLVISHQKNQNPRFYKNRSIQSIVILAIACGVGIYAIDLDLDTYSKFARLFQKLFDAEDNESTRLLSPITSLYVFFEKPILGWGLVGALERYKYFNDDIALTSTSVFLISALGIAGILFTVLPIIGVIRLNHVNVVTRFLLIISFLFIVNKEPHVYFTLTYALLYFSLSIALKSRIIHRSSLSFDLDILKSKKTSRQKLQTTQGLVQSGFIDRGMP